MTTKTAKKGHWYRLHNISSEHRSGSSNPASEFEFIWWSSLTLQGVLPAKINGSRYSNLCNNSHIWIYVYVGKEKTARASHIIWFGNASQCLAIFSLKEPQMRYFFFYFTFVMFVLRLPRFYGYFVSFNALIAVAASDTTQ